jgi:hypothetical protein
MRINIRPQSQEMREDTKALSFVMLELMERGSSYCKASRHGPAIEYGSL